MKKKIVLLTLVSVFLLSAVVGSQLIAAVAAQSVGVSPGDWAEYAVTLSGNWTIPELNATWVKITVQAISDPSITFQLTIHYANGSEPTTTNVVDVVTGQGNGTGWFIAKNLNQGELIYTDPPPTGQFGISLQGATINETIWRTYPVVGTVEVNHLNLTVSGTIPEVGTQTMIMNWYWYKTTGMTAEFSGDVQLQPLEGPTMWAKLEAVTSDIIPEFPPALILPLFMIATLIAVWLGKTIWSTKKPTKKTSSCA